MTRKTFLTLAIILGIGSAGAGSTLAVLTDREQVVNEFSFVGEDGLNGILTEPGWSQSRGLLTVPGETIPKDPQVTNTSELDMDALTALQVEFVYGTACQDPSRAEQLLSDEDMRYVADVYRIDWNADDAGDWVRFAGETSSDQVQHFYYRNVLKRNFPNAGDTTVPLFTEVSVPKEVNNERYRHIQEMGGFEIRISGTLVQQMAGEKEYGLNSPEEAYREGLFTFQTAK